VVAHSYPPSRSVKPSAHGCLFHAPPLPRGLTDTQLAALALAWIASAGSPAKADADHRCR
jgi:hypothetical protein